MNKTHRLIVLAAVFGVLAAACAGRGAQSLGRVPPDPEETTATPRPEETEPSGGTLALEVWFARHFSITGEGGQELGGTGLFVSERSQERTPAVARAAMTALLEGPTAQEEEVGVFSAIPPGTRLLDLTIEEGIATVDLSEEFGTGGGTAGETMQLAQVIYTLTQFPTVEGILLEIEGERVTEYGGHGIILDEPQKRGDYADLLPPVLVQSPVVGARVTSPLAISGTANVFEATVSIRLVDAEGREIVRTFTTATCGTGCRGEYSESVRFDVPAEQVGAIEVFEASAIDGSPNALVRIPVVLVP